MENRQADLEKNEAPQNEQPPQDATKEKDDFLVRFEEGDTENPKNFSPWYKAWITFIMSMLAFLGAFAASITAPAQAMIAKYLNVSLEVTVLFVALYILGFALGPILWGPVSEVYGRKWSMLPAAFALGLFSIGTAASTNLASIIITRFLGGVFGSAAVSNVAASLGDFYDPQTRGIAMAFYAMLIMGGPTIAPVIGAAVVTSHLGWRWSEYILAIMVFFVVGIAFFGMPETYAPVLLKRKAQRMRKSTGNNRYWHPHDNEQINLSNIVTKYLSRPLRMFFTEPIVTFIAMYASFVYALPFMTFEVFPIVFLEQREWPLVVSTLPFLSVFVGCIVALTVNIGAQPWYIRAVKNNKGRAVPEARLPPMVIGAVFSAIGLFWFGWTAKPSISWVSPVFAAAFIGAGFNITFQQCINFLVDTYGPYAASATSANTMLRSLVACGLPLAVRPMFLTLGVGPASSILGGVACLALPVPFVFMKYGLKLRTMSKFAPVVED